MVCLFFCDEILEERDKREDRHAKIGAFVKRWL